MRKKLVYLGSLRNAAADMAGQFVDYKGESRYMMSPLEFLVGVLETTELGDAYELVGIIFDDDANNPKDQEKLAHYGFSIESSENWFYPKDMIVQGREVAELIIPVPSSYRTLPLGDFRRLDGKHDFENRLQKTLDELEADLVLIDGLIVILDELVRPDAAYERKVVNIHPGITEEGSPYERRGAYGTLDALYGARGLRVVDWSTMETETVSPVNMTGASFHYVDTGIDSGEVIVDILATNIHPDDSILELRWNNFNNSLFPAIQQGLSILSQK